jgi:hypothetical protein
MRAPIRRVRQFAFLFVFGVPLAAQAADDAAAVSVVDKVENGAKVFAGDTVTVVIIGMPVHLRDELRTVPEGRLRVTFRDGTALTLGEKANVVIDRYVYDPERDTGETVRQVASGAFLFASGRIKGLGQHRIVNSTPVADIGGARDNVLGRSTRPIRRAHARGGNLGVQSSWQRGALRNWSGH